jgi:XTP/dITP diphosphohydrolase
LPKDLTFYIPPSQYNMEAKLQAFARLLEIMDRLRAECPWDKKQTFETLRNLTIEETYELADALLEGDLEGIKEEIGDIMLHMVFYAKIAHEKGAFDIADALNAICEKLIQRHPHIYGNVQVQNEADVKRNWEQLKLASGKKSVLEGVPNALPALVKAYRMQEKAAQVGFEWDNKQDVWAKVKEELAEFEQATQNGIDPNTAEDEFGDILFALINYARWIDVDPETALERTNKKFKRRFEYIEAHAHAPLTDLSLAQMDALWDEAKKLERL